MAQYYAVRKSPQDDTLQHHGVKGQKWGVRKAVETGGASKRSRKDSDWGKKKKVNRAKASSVAKKGVSRIDAKKATKIKTIVASSAAIASGALWVASALVPGAPVLNTIAAAANIVSVVSGQE